MSDSFQDAPASARSNNDDRGIGFGRGNVIQETMEENETVAHQDGDTFSDEIDRDIPESVLAKIDALKRAAPVADTTTDETTGEEDPEAKEPKVEIVAEQADDPEKPADDEEPKKEESKPDDNLVRLSEANRKLVEENERLRAFRAEKPKATAWDDAERHYYETDTITGIRHVLAQFLGVEKPDDPKVEAELRDLYADLTAKELGVTPDPAHQAKREAARTRALWDREKRQRTAKEQEKADEGPEADTKKAESAAAFIAPRLTAKAADYPLLTNLAEVFDGMKPEALLWKVMERESKTGRLAITADDDANIAAAAKLVEEHYAGLVDRVSKARPTTSNPPSTAKPTEKAAVMSASKGNAPKPRGANLTTADASVAPTTPPAKKPAPTNEQRPKFKTNEERKAWALRHLKD